MFTDCHERRLMLTPPLHVRFPSRRTQSGQDHHNDSTSLCIEDVLDYCDGVLNSLWRDDLDHHTQSTVDT
ncbi:hypothetical protein E2C01_062220 [Portunus trituberculatus]|uniref:Uncharacterized protein n=1 Tax=Portunus trituberculatus TaxID=210409 RepID=A0A5B7H7C0_PORTR|nr:hypothetical protein [Portunus trituberculatus]